MKSNEPIKPIYRVEYKNRLGETEARSVFFQHKEDAQEYAEAFKHINCEAYIHKYWLK